MSNSSYYDLQSLIIRIAERLSKIGDAADILGFEKLSKNIDVMHIELEKVLHIVQELRDEND